MTPGVIPPLKSLPGSLFICIVTIVLGASLGMMTGRSPGLFLFITISCLKSAPPLVEGAKILRIIFPAGIG